MASLESFTTAANKWWSPDHGFCLAVFLLPVQVYCADESTESVFAETIRPLLVKYCGGCHKAWRGPKT